MCVCVHTSFCVGGFHVGVCQCVSVSLSTKQQRVTQFAIGAGHFLSSIIQAHTHGHLEPFDRYNECALHSLGYCNSSRRGLWQEVNLWHLGHWLWDPDTQQQEVLFAFSFPFFNHWIRLTDADPARSYTACRVTRAQHHSDSHTTSRNDSVWV